MSNFKWLPPIQFSSWKTTDDPNSFKVCDKNIGEIPLYPHPGSFAFNRKNHTHEGIDVYAPNGTSVFAMEDGVVVAIENFTGPLANSPWWNDTKAILIEGASGVIVYGEIELATNFRVGQKIVTGRRLGFVKQVLKKDKGRPMSMLHLELHKSGTKQSLAWEKEKPTTLLDPTPLCMHWAL